VDLKLYIHPQGVFYFYPTAVAQLPQFRIYVTLTDKLASHFLPTKMFLADISPAPNHTDLGF
jgi:hypothetical protein